MSGCRGWAGAAFTSAPIRDFEQWMNCDVPACLSLWLPLLPICEMWSLHISLRSEPYHTLTSHLINHPIGLNVTQKNSRKTGRNRDRSERFSFLPHTSFIWLRFVFHGPSIRCRRRCLMGFTEGPSLSPWGQASTLELLVIRGCWRVHLLPWEMNGPMDFSYRPHSTLKHAHINTCTIKM